MKYLILLAILSCSVSVSAQNKEDKKFYLRQIKIYQQKQDQLGLRVAIKKLSPFKLTLQEWTSVRRIIHQNPHVGFDLVFKWDQLGLKRLQTGNPNNNISKLILEADDLMLSEKFEAAFSSYQRVAKVLKKDVVKNKDNLFLYYYVIHSMGRALYGAGRYADSFEVLGWLNQEYPRARQVIFEKMWAAFRMGRLDLTLGMIASQKSSYFSSYVNPETYLIQIYSLKRLCRDDELKAVRKQIENFKKELAQEKSTFTYKEWAKSDLETLSLLNLAEQKIEKDTEDDALYSLKVTEQKKLIEVLQNKFILEKSNIDKQLEKVLAYSYLALSSSAFQTKRTDIRSRNELIKNGEEFWPAEDQEDWVDEIGSHIYIGDSQCKK